MALSSAETRISTISKARAGLACNGGFAKDVHNFSSHFFEVHVSQAEHTRAHLAKLPPHAALTTTARDETRALPLPALCHIL